MAPPHAACGAYTPTCGTLTFGPDQTTQTVPVPVAGLTAPGLPNQTFYFAVANPVNATIARQLAMATIENVATTTTVVPAISVGDVTVSVGSAGTEATFTVGLSAAATDTVTMIYGTGDGTATAASGAYTPTWGTLTFSPGETLQTVSVPVAGLTAAGLPDKTFFSPWPIPSTARSRGNWPWPPSSTSCQASRPVGCLGFRVAHLRILELRYRPELNGRIQRRSK